MTPKQLRIWYVQTIIQEARIKLRLINCIRLAHGDGQKVQYAISNIQLQAFPPDPDNDPEMSRETIMDLRRALDASRNPSVG